MKAVVTLPNGSEMRINAHPKEIQRLAALKGYSVQIVPDRDVFLAGAPWLFNDVRTPRGNA